MARDPNEFGDGRPDLSEVKRMRREYPSGWLELSKDPARALLIDAILDCPPSYEFTPSEISPRTGVTAQSVRNHISTLEELGIVEKVGTNHYKVNNSSRVLAELEELNSAVTAVRSCAANKDIDSTDPDEAMDNSSSVSHNGGSTGFYANKNPITTNAD